MSNGAILPLDGDGAGGCCGPGRPAGAKSREGATGSAPVDSAAGRRAAGLDLSAAVSLPGGSFLMGTDEPTFPLDGEGPVREVAVGAFAIDRYAVSNRRFAAFVAATGYTTEAERFGWSFVFHSFLPADHPPTRAVAAAPWWRVVEGADWRHPFGPASDLAGRQEHPVVHVSWRDARAYARWAGGRLPSEAEWEYAGRGGLTQKRFPWGDRLVDGGRHRCNVWQGEFPKRDHARDGYHGTAPVDAFEPNGFGLYNVVGNVWEWCEDRWAVSADPAAADLVTASGAEAASGTEADGGEPHADLRVMKGGSYLCHASYCNRYRLAARSSSTADSATGHLGFRVAYDLPVAAGA